MYQVGTKLGVSEFFYTHVGRYVGNGMVFHNHWRNGAEIIPLSQFRNGKKVMVMDQGVVDRHAFLSRVQQAIKSGKPYNLLTNNCEHTASLVSTGIPSSPQLACYGILSLIAIGIGMSQSAK